MRLLKIFSSKKEETLPMPGIQYKFIYFIKNLELNISTSNDKFLKTSQGSFNLENVNNFDNLSKEKNSQNDKKFNSVEEKNQGKLNKYIFYSKQNI